MTYFLDSNIVSYIIKNNPLVIEYLKKLIINGNIIKIPSIVCYEVKRGLLAINAVNKLKLFDQYIKIFGIVPLSQNDLDKAAEEYAKLKQSGKLIEDADLFIGCSALENNAILLSNNERHLKRITGLKVEAINL